MHTCKKCYRELPETAFYPGNVVKKHWTCIPCMRDYARKHYYTRSQRVHELYLSLRQLVFSRYGNRCACCGYSNLEKRIHGMSFLQIDHVNGRGNKDRNGEALYRQIIHQAFPSTYRILCGACNAAMEPGNPKCEIHR